MKSNSEARVFRIGLAGLGTVGSSLYRHLKQNRRLIEERTGFAFEVPRVAVRDLSRRRSVEVPAAELTSNWRELVEDPSIDVIVELMGGIDEPLRLVRAALEAGKPVVTGNKALLAEHGAEIFALAAKTGVPVFYEAAVAGGIPVIKAVRESLVGNHITGIHGIINGTSNYILTRMAETGLDFRSALAEAQEKGYAEADPTLDINGWDAAHKAIILASLSYGYWVNAADIRVEGIEKVGAQDIVYAAKLGYGIKLVAVIKTDDEGRVETRVQPSLVPKEHILASVRGVHNAIVAEGDMVGQVMFFGPGAGGDATASSVVSDLVDAAHALRGEPRNPGFVSHGLYGKTKPSGETISEFYLRIPVNDQPGVIAGIAGILATRSIGIAATVSLPPSEMPEGKFTEVIFLTHDARLDEILAANQEIARLACVTDPPVCLRVERI
jgi:homoserine dehydrogenase